jgi:hypothetical protein
MKQLVAAILCCTAMMNAYGLTATEAEALSKQGELNLQKSAFSNPLVKSVYDLILKETYEEIALIAKLGKERKVDFYSRVNPGLKKYKEHLNSGIITKNEGIVIKRELLKQLTKDGYQLRSYSNEDHPTHINYGIFW